MDSEVSFPVFLGQGSYSPNLLSSGAVGFICPGIEGIQTKEIKKGFISLPEGAIVKRIVTDTSEHVTHVVAKLGATICIPSSK